jgi:hypothetical protein
VEIHRDGETRFAGLVRIDDASFLEAADFVRTHRASFLFVSLDDVLTEQRVRLLFSRVFPKGDSTVDRSRVVDQVGDGAELCILVSGAFDDREAGIDAFMSTEWLDTVAKVLC